MGGGLSLAPLMSSVVKRALHLWADCQATSKVLEWCEVSGQTVCPPPPTQECSSQWAVEKVDQREISGDPIRPATYFLKVGT